LFLINEKDKEIYDIFENYLTQKSSEYFISSIMAKTEESLEIMLNKHFRKDDVAKI